MASAAKTAISRPSLTKAAPAPVDTSETDMQAAAEAAIATVLGESKSMPKLKVRTSVFKAVNDESGQDMAQAVTETYFASDAALNGILEGLGFKVVGSNVVAV